MTITLEDKCIVCKESLFNMDGWKECKFCGARICNLCFKKMEEEQKTLCPNCGKNSATSPYLSDHH